MKCRVMKVAAWHIRARILNTTLMGIKQETKMRKGGQVICVEFSEGSFKRHALSMDHQWDSAMMGGKNE